MDAEKGKSLKKTGKTSLKVSLFFHLMAALAVSVILSALIQKFAAGEQEKIWLRYTENIQELYEYQNEYSQLFGALPPVPETRLEDLAWEDGILVRLYDFLQSWSPLILSFSSVFTVVTLFYNRRLKKPLALLTESAERIGSRDLDFTVCYDREDEMGALCDAFEAMREQLQKNNQTMWKLLEDQRQMRAAFSHDLRTPLTVLKGYAEYLIHYYPEDRLSKEKVMETLTELKEQSWRIEQFADTMKEINRLDERVIKKRKISPELLVKRSEAVLSTLSESCGKRYQIDSQIRLEQFNLDLDIYLEILENIAGNGMRYAKNLVRLELSEGESCLYANVYDDGRGFSREDLRSGGKPYYHDKEAEGDHYGMGLYLCDSLCRKHGGNMALGNGENGGAWVEIRLDLSET